MTRSSEVRPRRLPPRRLSSFPEGVPALVHAGGFPEGVKTERRVVAEVCPRKRTEGGEVGGRGPSPEEIPGRKLVPGGLGERAAQNGIFTGEAKFQWELPAVSEPEKRTILKGRPAVCRPGIGSTLRRRTQPLSTSAPAFGHKGRGRKLACGLNGSVESARCRCRCDPGGNRGSVAHPQRPPGCSRQERPAGWQPLKSFRC